MIGDLNGPVGVAFATLLGGQVEGHTRVLALLNGDVAVKPATLMVSKVTVKKNKYTNILMGTVQAAIANGVLDAVRAGDIPREKANDLGIIYSVWLDPAVQESAIYAESWAGHRPVQVTIESDQIVIRRAGEDAGDDEDGDDDD